MITDLTNTSWVINDSYSIPSIPSPHTSKEFYINFTTEGDLSFVGIEFNESTTYGDITYIDNILYDNGSGTSIFVAVNGGATWQDNSYKTVHISGGTDATNSSLISWFEVNATQIVQIDYIDKVVLTSGDEYYLKDSISGYIAESDLVAGNNIQISATGDGVSISKVNGGQVKFRFIRYPKPTITDLTGTTWYFNSSLQSIDPPTMYNITFTSNNNEYVKLGNVSGAYSDEVWYNDGSSWTYAYEGGWLNQNYRTIIIADGTDIANSTLIAWLQANATQVS